MAHTFRQFLLEDIHGVATRRQQQKSDKCSSVKCEKEKSDAKLQWTNNCCNVSTDWGADPSILTCIKWEERELQTLLSYLTSSLSGAKRVNQSSSPYRLSRAALVLFTVRNGGQIHCSCAIGQANIFSQQYDSHHRSMSKKSSQLAYWWSCEHIVQILSSFSTYCSPSLLPDKNSVCVCVCVCVCVIHFLSFSDCFKLNVNNMIWMPAGLYRLRESVSH